MEAAVRNLLGPGDRALAVVAGKFGERWTGICKAAGIACTSLCKTPGEAASADEILSALAEAPDCKALLIQGCETSTATSHDLETISRRVRSSFPHLYIVVDAITALGSQPLESEDWGLDAVIGGSQKAFGISPGLAFLGLSSRAVERIEARDSDCFYFDLAKEISGQRDGRTAYTAAVTLVESLHASTEAILDHGLDEVIDSARRSAGCAREGLQAMGFRLLSQSPANAVTACFPPPGVDSEELRQTTYETFGLQMAGGQGDLKGRIVRVSHLGYTDLLDVFTVLSAIELSLMKLGASGSAGAGLKAALQAATRLRNTSSSPVTAALPQADPI